MTAVSTSARVQQRVQARIQTAARARLRRRISQRLEEDPTERALLSVPDGQRPLMAKQLKGALVRLHTAELYAERQTKRRASQTLAAVALLFLPALLHGASAALSSWRVVGGFVAGVWAIVILTVIPVGLALLIGRLLRAFWAGPRLRVSVVLILSLGMLVSTTRSRHQLISDTRRNGFSLAAARAAVTGEICGCLLVIFIAICLIAYASKLRTTRDRLGRPFDEVVVALARAIAELQENRHRWFSNDRVLQWSEQLEAVAVTAERASMYPGRLSEIDRGSKEKLRAESMRIAAVFRSHKQDLAQAHSPEAVDAVITSLLAGLKAFMSGDRATLLANAPTAPRPPGRVARLLSRMIPALVFIAAGIVLPLVPIVASQPEISGSMRWTFIVMGVVSLVTQRNDVATQVNEVFGKAVPWGK